MEMTTIVVWLARLGGLLFLVYTLFLGVTMAGTTSGGIYLSFVSLAIGSLCALYLGIALYYRLRGRDVSYT